MLSVGHFALCLLLLLDTSRVSQQERVRLRHSSPRGCSKCPVGWGVASQCTSVTDTECTPCAEGISYSAHRSFRLPCFPCARCGAGLFVAHRCTLIRDTVCDACASTVEGPKPQDFYDKCQANVDHRNR